MYGAGMASWCHGWSVGPMCARNQPASRLAMTTRVHRSCPDCTSRQWSSSRATRRAPVGWHSLRPRFGPLQKSIALRSACVPIGFGLVCTRTNAPQARTDRPGSQKCPKWPLGKVLPRPFTFNLAVPFRAFTRSVAAFLHWFHTPPALKTILCPQDLYEVIKFQISIFGCARSSEQLHGPWPNRANFENACNAES